MKNNGLIKYSYYCLVLFSVYALLSPKDSFASNLKINEVVIHPSSGNKEWVEFYNPDKIDISSYWIDDDTDFTNDSGNSSKKSLQGIQGSDTQYPYFEVSSMFNNDGDHVVLFGSDGAIVDQYEYSKDPGSDISIGRSPDGSGEFTVLATATKGSANSLPLPSSTPSPLPSPTPTHTPTPSPKPTPIKSGPTLTPKPITQSSSNSSTSIAKTIIASAYQPTIVLQISSNISPSIDMNATDEAVLGTSTSATQTVIKEKTIVEGTKTQQNDIFLMSIPFIGGALLLASCGILIYRKRKNTNMVE